MEKKTISGFSKLSKRGKIKWIVENFFKDPEIVMRELKSYWLPNEEQQKILDGFSENTISNYPLPYGVAPNFVINDKTYCVPMVTEESSVVAAAASAAKFWMHKGGFKAEVIGTEKLGQIHFLWEGPSQKLFGAFKAIKGRLIQSSKHLTRRMEERGGGITDIELKDFTAQIPYCYQLLVSFETCDSMGANFINSVLEHFSQELPGIIENDPQFEGTERDMDVIMSILSNNTPQSLVRVWVECPVDDLGECNGMDAYTFAERFCKAVRIAEVDPYRATTHNKGIFNGIDAVILATGNDFRAIEAAGHTYAARNGQYTSLSHCSLNEETFKFWMDVPLAVGTVGGLTDLHPIAKRSFELLGDPSAEELMQIIAATGLAQNFAALRSLITTGIQYGHMKMHLHNMLVRLKATDEETQAANRFFEEHVISSHAVEHFILELRHEKEVLSDADVSLTEE